MAATLLVELLTEELPPKSLARLAEAFADGIRTRLENAKLLDGGARATVFATPRRLAVTVTAVRERAPDAPYTEKIMPVAVALDAQGRPTAALLKKLQAKGIPVERVTEFERRMDGKSETLFHSDIAKGETLAAVLAGVVTDAVARLPVPKLMRWGDGEAQFVRPVHGLVMLHGARLVPGSVLGLASGDTTRGHRFLSQGPLAIPSADDYARVLEVDGKVLASFGQRRERIAAALAAEADRLGLRLNAGHEALLDEVTALVEWPVVYAGAFEEQYLAVPQECLILTMQQNQKYFPLLDGDARLTNRFLIVSNMAVADARHIVGGNQRVVRPRLADARFFFDQDRRTPLESRVERLTKVVYHNKLGSQRGRIERLRRLARHIAGLLGADTAAADRAALLAKADLVTDMVGEFPELQGIMGRYYARHDGEAEVVAQAIEAHYRPRYAGDALPEGNVALAVALADRLDALAGFFGIGQVPTGDKDPFALRRAALGVLRMLGERALPLDLAALIGEAIAGLREADLRGDTLDALHDFMLERLRHHLREAGHAVEAVDAVLAGRPTRIDRVAPRLAAVREFVALPEAQALAAANKRIVNILRKAEAPAGGVDVALLQDEAERVLFGRLNELAPQVRSLADAEDYTAALRALAALRAPVDSFFDHVMVMADEPLTRGNRLALLAELARLMNQVADISRLAVAK